MGGFKSNSFRKLIIVIKIYSGQTKENVEGKKTVQEKQIVKGARKEHYLGGPWLSVHSLSLCFMCT